MLHETPAQEGSCAFVYARPQRAVLTRAQLAELRPRCGERESHGYPRLPCSFRLACEARVFDGLRRDYVEPVRSFGRPARLFLAMIIVNGVVYSGWQLFFNLYILQSGYTRDFLGLVNSMPYAGGLIFGIPLGRLSDRIGRRASILIGLVLMGVFMLMQVIAQDRAVIVGSAFLYGISNMLFVVSQPPLMARVSDAQNRTMLFSLSYGLQTLAASVGALFAGQLPQVFSSLLKTSGSSAAAYQAVLITSILLGSAAIIPMWLMNESRPQKTDAAAPDDGSRRSSQPGRRARRSLSPGILQLTGLLALPQLLIGFGAAILIPYMNVFYKETFAISDSLLGVLFSVSALLIGIGSIVAPRLSMTLGGKIRAVVATQAGSLFFLLLWGFAPYLWLSAVGYLIRTALMNMASPLYSAFSMERAPEADQGFVSSVLNITWTVGWAVGPFVSGLVQTQYGFRPLFIATAVLYASASGLIWRLFRRAEGVPPPQLEAIPPTIEFPE